MSVLVCLCDFKKSRVQSIMAEIEESSTIIEKRLLNLAVQNSLMTYKRAV